MCCCFRKKGLQSSFFFSCHFRNRIFCFVLEENVEKRKKSGWRRRLWQGVGELYRAIYLRVCSRVCVFVHVLRKKKTPHNPSRLLWVCVPGTCCCFTSCPLSLNNWSQSVRAKPEPLRDDAQAQIQESFTSFFVSKNNKSKSFSIKTNNLTFSEEIFCWVGKSEPKIEDNRLFYPGIYLHLLPLAPSPSHLR